MGTPKAARPMRVPLTYTPTGERVYWTVTRQRYFGSKGGIRQGWFFTDDGDYERFGGDTWRELVDRFSRTAENHNMVHRLS